MHCLEKAEWVFYNFSHMASWCMSFSNVMPLTFTTRLLRNLRKSCRTAQPSLIILTLF